VLLEWHVCVRLIACLRKWQEDVVGVPRKMWRASRRVLVLLGFQNSCVDCKGVVVALVHAPLPH
jgi:hypothetical protein